ncbi:MBL fold metallo-hydrolase [Methanobrevibacter sp. 87.7]|uniref:MBL fold metallo-hydrolase n=1 Tax=Methanobrevibacter sp. 87.7 TaxID=387957 RepID=UPI000B4FF01B|nr:MBL fold metallo-hydrolase [Methanobrevibacter sp. 87.7]OWT33872.1 MBL fold metallo-hydrolase [Methanobrevibacter sp. 87.7]
MERVGNVVAIIGMDLDSNSYIFDDVLVDPGTGRHLDYFFENLKEANIKIEDINKIVNTHCHFDHIGADEYLQKEYGLEVYMHELDADAVKRADGEETVASHFGSKVPDIDVSVIHENDKFNDFKVIHTPGHTHGGICLYDGKSLITGDTVFSDGSFGRSDFKTGSTEDMKNSLNRLSKLDVENVFTGHGPYIVGNGSASVKLSSDNANKWY